MPTKRTRTTNRVYKTKTGRPSIYSKELAQEICKGIAKGLTLKDVCSKKGMPNVSTVLDWCVVHEDFSKMYASARFAQAHVMVDEIIAISDDNSLDEIDGVDKSGKPRRVIDHDHISRARLRVDSRKWYVAKVLPKIFGEKVTQELTGPDGGPIQTANRNAEIAPDMDPKKASQVYKDFIGGS